MKRKFLLLLLPGFLLAQTATYSGTVPTTFAITNTSNGAFSGSFLANGGNTLTVGSGTLSTATLQFRMRSNAPRTN